MPTIKVAKAFSLLTATNEKPQRFEVGEHPVTEEIASHWYVQAHLEKPEPDPAAFDPETATRDEMTGWLHAQFSSHLAGLSDDDLRKVAIQRHRQSEEVDEGLPPEPATPAAETGQADQQTDPGASGHGETAPDPAQAANQAAAARKAEIREQMKAMGAELPHHNASLDKHQAALAAALAAKTAPESAAKADAEAIAEDIALAGGPAVVAEAETETKPDPNASQA